MDSAGLLQPVGGDTACLSRLGQYCLPNKISFVVVLKFWLMFSIFLLSAFLSFLPPFSLFRFTLDCHLFRSVGRNYCLFPEARHQIVFRLFKTQTTDLLQKLRLTHLKHIKIHSDSMSSIHMYIYNVFCTNKKIVFITFLLEWFDCK